MGGRPGGQRTARHDVLGADRLRGRVEVLHVAGQHLDGADAQADRAGVEQIEIDQFVQRGIERRGIVDADRLGRAGRHENARAARAARRSRARPIKRGNRRAGLVEHFARIVVVGEGPGGEAARHLFPERAQSLAATLGRIAGDDGRVDGADRDAGNPARHVAGLGQRGIRAGLISAERSAALQHENRLFLESGHASGSAVQRGSTPSGNYAGPASRYPRRIHLGRRSLAVKDDNMSP